MSPDISHFVTSGKASVIFDGQFGSTGKGLAGAWVGEHNHIDWATTNASANAGHTSIIDGKPVVLFHIPSTYLTARQNGVCNIYVNAGAIIDLDVLVKEIEELGIRHAEICVNPNAAVITQVDRDEEADRTSSQAKIASTQKGVGAALARKVRRHGPNLGQFIERSHRKVPFQLKTVSLNQKMQEGASVVVEVPQGFSLSVNSSGFYPYTTSRDCTLQQGLADAGIAPRLFHKSMAVLRTYPIRVGNIMDGERQIGYSGHVYPDQRETSWEAIGVPEERTTVTKRIRRVFSFSAKQYEHMVRHSMPDIVFLNFANYCTPTRVESISDTMHQIEKALGIQPLHYFGYGPASADISEYIRR
jgi:adenylosuccinate synthase